MYLCIYIYIYRLIRRVLGIFTGLTVFKGLEGFKRFKRLEGLEGFKGFRAGKRQTWTPIRSH